MRRPARLPLLRDLRNVMSDRGSPGLQTVAERLLAWESRSVKGSARKGRRPARAATFRVCAKLRGSLTRLMGAGGFRSLLSRALVLAVPQVPWLGNLEVQADGALAGLDRLAGELSAEELSRGEVAVVRELLGLLQTFIGPALTLGLLQNAWPNQDFGEFEASP